MKEYVLWVMTPDKEFNISYVRDENTTMDEMLMKIEKLIIDSYHTDKFVIRGVFKL